MKKLALLLVGFAMVACKKEAPKEVAETPTVDSVAAPKPQTNVRLRQLVAQFWANHEAMLKKLPVLTPAQANSMFEAYKQKNDEILTQINQAEEKVVTDYYFFYKDDNGTPKPVADSLREKEEILKRARLEFAYIGEGMAEISPVPDYYLKLFKNHVTPDYKEFLTLKAADDATLWTADAGIAITWPDLGKRVINWENFVKKYPQSKLLPKARMEYLQYRYSYLFGMDNTPTYEYEDVKLYPEMVTEFERFLAKYPTSDTAKLVQQMLDSNGKGFEQLKQMLNLELEEATKQLYGE